MLSISLFVEDFGHEEFLRALIGRIAREQEISVTVHPRSVRGGRGKVLSELAQYVADIERVREPLPDRLDGRPASESFEEHLNPVNHVEETLG